MATWQSRLTKTELKHLRVDAGVQTLTAFKTTHAFHQMHRAEHPRSPDPCLTCKHIARKLGLEVA